MLKSQVAEVSSDTVEFIPIVGASFVKSFSKFDHQEPIGMLQIIDHPLLEAHVFVSEFPASLNQLEANAVLSQYLSHNASIPLERPDEVNVRVREMLRVGGYKPTGRGKPASEYLSRAVAEHKLQAINLAVDVCNVVSLHSGLPISVVDLDKLACPLKIDIAPANTEYIFNVSGQSMRLDGLLCMFDQHGPCANAVKDSQRTKTGPDSRKTLSIIWGTKSLPQHTKATTIWYQKLLQTHDVAMTIWETVPTND